MYCVFTCTYKNECFSVGSLETQKLLDSTKFILIVSLKLRGYLVLIF